MVQFGRSATGASSNGVTTRNAAALFTGAGPGATVALSAATPSRMKSLRHSRTVSSRTPKASAMRGLVQPDSVSSTARARSASPRSRDRARAISTVHCFLGCHEWRLPGHALHLQSGRQPISPPNVGQAAGVRQGGNILPLSSPTPQLAS